MAAKQVNSREAFTALIAHERLLTCLLLISSVYIQMGMKSRVCDNVGPGDPIECKSSYKDYRRTGSSNCSPVLPPSATELITCCLESQSSSRNAR
jgi:hypothetical protein